MIYRALAVPSLTQRRHFPDVVPSRGLGVGYVVRAKERLLCSEDNAAARRGADLLQAPHSVGIIVGRAVVKILIKAAIVDLAFEKECRKVHLIFCGQAGEPSGRAGDLRDQPLPVLRSRVGICFSFLALRPLALSILDSLAVAALAWCAKAAVFFRGR